MTNERNDTTIGTLKVTFNKFKEIKILIQSSLKKEISDNEALEILINNFPKETFMFKNNPINRSIERID